MNKIIASIVGLLVLTTPAFAWNWMVDIDASVLDASVDIGAGAIGEGYMFGTTAGIAGSGEIGIFGHDSSQHPDHGIMYTDVGGSGAEGVFYADQDMAVTGCCPECGDCPDEYLYVASQGVAVDGSGEISLEQGVNAYWSEKNMQKLNADGEGDFLAGMSSTLYYGDEEYSHAMGAYGEGVWFRTFGIQKTFRDDCENKGFFFTVMGYEDDPCDGEICQ